MDPIYTVIIAILAVLAVSGLFVGVTNDAVNFLNSAIGSKAAPRRVILIVASIGILVGTLTSSGMMEVARNGMFDPGMFSFHEVILLYLSVMFANIILLDLYNSWGLPTSTTVSLIFCLLGAAIAVSTFKIAGSDALSMGDLGEFIHAGRAFGIVAAILLIAGVVYSLYLHGDFDISSYVMRRARSNAPKQTFEAYKANQKERREASFNYPLFLGAVYMAAALFIAYVFY